METLRRHVRQASWRLLAQSLVGKLAWCWFATLLVAMLAIGASRYWPVADERAWVVGWLSGALVVGTIAALAWTWSTRVSSMAVAAEIDRRFGLKERVSSSLSLPADVRDSEIGQALVEDTIRRVERIEVPTAFGIRLDRSALLPLLPAAAVFGMLLFAPERVEPTKSAAAVDTVQTKKGAEAVAKKLEEKRKAAEAAGLEEVDGFLAQLEKGAKDLVEKTPADRKQMLQALNDLTRDAEKRRQQLANSADLKKQLNQLKNIEPGPAQKMASALKNGDLKKAIEELDKLSDKLAKDELKPEEKEALVKQLEQMQKAMSKVADAHKESQEELKREIERERQAGNTAAAEKLQQQLDKLAEKDDQMAKMKQMAAQLKQAGESMKAGEAKKAGEALAKMADDLKDLSRQISEMAMLDDAIDDLGDWKNAMACKECDGEGCAECQGGGMKKSEKWSRSDFARGSGVGAGKRDKKETDANFVDSQVPQNVGKGAMVVKGSADGPNRKGQVQQAIKEEFAGAEQQAAEALSDQRLPHHLRDHAKGYFEALRDGQK